MCRAQTLSTQGLLSTVSWASSASGRTLLLLGSTSCTSLGWSNRKSMFPWQHLAFQGVADCPELLLAGARLSLAGVSHSALGDRRQGTLLPTLIRQYHSRKSVSFLKVSGFLWSCMSSYFLSCFSTYLKGATCPD